MDVRTLFLASLAFQAPIALVTALALTRTDGDGRRSAPVWLAAAWWLLVVAAVGATVGASLTGVSARDPRRFLAAIANLGSWFAALPLLAAGFLSVPASPDQQARRIAGASLVCGLVGVGIAITTALPQVTPSVRILIRTDLLQALAAAVLGWTAFRMLREQPVRPTLRRRIVLAGLLVFVAKKLVNLVPLAGAPEWLGFVLFGTEGMALLFLSMSSVVSLLQQESDLLEDERDRRQADDRRFRAMIEHSSDLIALVAVDGTVRTVSDSVLPILGWQPAEVIGRSVWEFIAPEEVAAARGRVAALLASGAGAADMVVVQFRRADGTFAPLELRRSLHREPDGTMALVVNARDLSERRALMDALQRREAEFRAILENGQDLIGVFSLDGRFTYVSPSVTRILGWQPLEMIGRSAGEFIHPDDGEIASRLVEETAARPGEPVTATFRFRRRDGDHVWIETIRMQREDPASGIPLVFASGRDVTERRRMGEEMARTQRLESVGRLAGGIAHDFNNYLTVIQANVDAVRGELGDAHPLAQELDDALAAARRGGDLTRQLLTFARPRADAQVAVSPARQLDELRRMLDRLLGGRHALRIATPADDWRVRIDPTQFDQVVVNLVVNARDAMPDGGDVRITIEHWPADAGTPDGQPSHDRLCLAVEDDGPGIADDVAEHLFEPFFTTKPVGKGTGLGLAVCAGVVRAAQGEIRVGRAPSGGARFAVILPRANEPA